VCRLAPWGAVWHIDVLHCTEQSCDVLRCDVRRCDALPMRCAVL